MNEPAMSAAANEIDRLTALLSEARQVLTDADKALISAGCAAKELRRAPDAAARHLEGMRDWQQRCDALLAKLPAPDKEGEQS